MIRLSWLPSIRTDLEELCATYVCPLGVAVAWIEVESGGNLHETTSLGEVGYFQLSPEECAMMSLDAEKVASAKSYSLAAGMQLIDHYRVSVSLLIAGLGIVDVVNPGSEYFYRLTKMSHSIGAGATNRIVKDAAQAGRASDWDALRSFCIDHDAAYLSTLKHSPAKWVAFVDRWAEIGKPFGLELLVPSLTSP